MTADYRPIDCDQHSELELLALRQVTVTVTQRAGAGQPLELTGVIHDLRARAGVEYLVLRPPVGDEREIRLDQVQLVCDKAGEVRWRQKNVEI